ncbi:hypothetical protein AB0D08_38125 [Kitasatospora sp. NPDC048540]|uniref:hypothetical protein n=1 Tax=Kitasatospora sp. NPDC048540 TaxID=3155634 RepID=UPI0033E56AF8
MRRILAALEQLRPGTVIAVDVRVGPARVVQPDQGPDDRPTMRPARPPFTDRHTYQELRRRTREDATARRAALDEAAGAREEILRRTYNWLREPEHAHRPAIVDTRPPTPTSTPASSASATAPRSPSPAHPAAHRQSRNTSYQRGVTGLCGPPPRRPPWHAGRCVLRGRGVPGRPA